MKNRQNGKKIVKQFFEFSSILGQSECTKPPLACLVDDGASFDTWGSWGRVNSADTRVLRFVLIYCDSGAALADFFTLMKMLSNVNFISMAIKKRFLSLLK